jgi:hypothetical protein
MENIIPGIVALLIGFVFLVFHRSFGQKGIEFQNKIFGFNFGEWWVKYAQAGYFIIGTCFVVFGVLSIFHIIHFR